ncbi:hypothetical protein M5D96_012834 [Drosophila gunungcola]|uniref:Uncharacterized protein n=1 Tax=Drosophila gunungcola TaxID=103775 RepID=A0A9Q0BJN8_9MUSC|nr:hypothetical protein M5D96_012834 [Drosophila gunungcola]
MTLCRSPGLCRRRRRCATTPVAMRKSRRKMGGPMQ